MCGQDQKDKKIGLLKTAAWALQSGYFVVVCPSDDALLVVAV